jgi:hypothetical protein
VEKFPDGSNKFGRGKKKWRGINMERHQIKDDREMNELSKKR